jgi:murein L,D-transpeptidase YafK
MIATVVLAATATTSTAAAADPPCRSEETAVVILTDDHELTLCEKGRAGETYGVALGSGGVGKRKEGDNKTPLGAYTLQPPRASEPFGTFLEIGYPTREQRKKGYTGGDVGIHGPKRGVRFLGSLGTLVDWTRGCIAVATDREILQIAAWVNRLNVAVVRIERE